MNYIRVTAVSSPFIWQCDCMVILSMEYKLERDTSIAYRRTRPSDPYPSSFKWLETLCVGIRVNNSVLCSIACSFSEYGSCGIRHALFFLAKRKLVTLSFSSRCLLSLVRKVSNLVTRLVLFVVCRKGNEQRCQSTDSVFVCNRHRDSWDVGCCMWGVNLFITHFVAWPTSKQMKDINTDQ